MSSDIDNINNGLSKAELNGTLQMRFAGKGVMIKIFLAQGSADTAQRLCENFLEEISEIKDCSMLENVEALRVLIAMYNGDNDWVSDWLRKFAPDETKSFFTLFRYLYIIKVRAYIIDGRYAEALSLLERLQVYFIDYERTYGLIQAKLLRSVVMYRMKNEDWREEFKEVLDMTYEYQFTRIIADEGMAVLEMLVKIQYDDKEYLSTLVTLTRKQAILYPSYMVGAKKIHGKLTEAEKTVLKLCARGMRNNDIAQLLGVSLRTVKTHTTNIFNKLDVESRTQAIRTATELGIIK